MAVRISSGHATSSAANYITDYTGCFINFYTGTQPDDANTGATGTLLGTATLDGDGSTGLTFVTGDNAGEMKKSASAVWTIDWVATGTVGWARVYEATGTPGSTSTSEKRFDVACGLSGSGASCIMSTLDAVTSDTAAIQTFVYRVPRNAA